MEVEGGDAMKWRRFGNFFLHFAKCWRDLALILSVALKSLYMGSIRAIPTGLSLYVHLQHPATQRCGEKGRS